MLTSTFLKLFFILKTQLKNRGEKQVCVDTDSSPLFAPKPVLLVASAQADTLRRTPLCSNLTMADFAFNANNAFSGIGSPVRRYSSVIREINCSSGVLLGIKSLTGPSSKIL